MSLVMINIVYKIEKIILGFSRTNATEITIADS
jgi:hypothetical protein